MPSDIYERTLRIRSEHVNCRRILRTSSLFRLLQETSIAHTTELGFGRDKTLDRGFLWIISRQVLTISEMPCYDDEILIRSWPGDMLHVFFPRFYEIHLRGKCVIRGEALWLLMDEKTRTMVFPAEEGILIPGLPGGPSSGISSAIRAPENAKKAFSSVMMPRFSQTDINGHINNANYFDLLDDLLPSEVLSSGFPSRIEAEYLTEIKPGNAFRIRGFQNPEGIWYMEGVRAEQEVPETPCARPLFRIRETFSDLSF